MARSGNSPGQGLAETVTVTCLWRQTDAATKENVVSIGGHPAGFGLYLFDYKPEFRDSFGHGRQFGVIADEVERIVPEAVTIASDGYRRVCYSLIGVTRH